MARQTKIFDFTYPLVIEKGIVMELMICGDGIFDDYYPITAPMWRYQADIATIHYRGVNIYPIIDKLGGLGWGQEIEEAASKHIALLFEPEKMER